MSPTGVTPSMDGAPVVSVPVLSRSTVRALPSCSMAPEPLATMPRRAARERPDTSATGAARMSGQGVATTSTASPRTGSPLSPHAAAAMIRVTGRKTAAYRSAIRTKGARCDSAWRTRRTRAA